MQDSDNSLPIAIACPKCRFEFTTEPRKFKDPGYAICPGCGTHVSLRENPIPGADIFDFDN